MRERKVPLPLLLLFPRVAPIAHTSHPVLRWTSSYTRGGGVGRDRYPAKAAERLSDELACVSTAETSPSLLPPPLFPPSLTAPMLFLANLRLRRFPSSDRKERSSISNAIKIWKNNSSRSIFLSNRSINREIVERAFSKKKSEIFLALYSSLFYFPLQSVPGIRRALIFHVLSA